MGKKRVTKAGFTMKNSKFLFYEVCDVKKSFFCIEIDSFGVYFDLTDVFRLVYF